MANPDFGYCVCPLCRHDRAAVRIAANGKAYISCDGCVSNVRTLSSVGDRAIRALMTSRADAPAGGAALDGPAVVPPARDPEKPAAAPAAEVKPAKKRGMFSDALDVLGGGR